MILVFVILGIIIFACLIVFLFILSTLKFEIEKLHISNIEKKIKVDFILDIAVYLFNKVKLAKITIDNVKINNLITSGKLDIKKIKDNKAINKNFFRVLKNSKFKIEIFRIEGCFSTFDNVLSSSIYAIICAVIPILISKKMNGLYNNNLKFLNTNENYINVSLNCIFSVKMVNIINMLHYYYERKTEV